MIFLKKDGIESSIQNKVKLLSINDIFNRLSRDAWKSNVQYKLLYKDKRLLKVILMGNKSAYFFRYERIEVITSIEINKFEKNVKALQVDRGYYIVTGNIDGSSVLSSKIVIEDGAQFARHQKDCKDINFYRYMPA